MATTIGLTEIPTTLIELYYALKPLFINQAIALPSGANITMADDTWIGLGAAKGRIVFDDQAPDRIEITDATLDIDGLLSVQLTQTIYNVEAIDGNFVGTLVLGDGGTNLSHVSGSDGKFNTFVGLLAGRDLTDGDSNTLLGYAAGSSMTTGEDSVCIGRRAGSDLTTNGSAVIIGNLAGDSLTETSCVMIGSYSGYETTTGFNNVFVGYSSGRRCTTGTENVCLGYSAGIGDAGGWTGHYNTYIGVSSGQNSTTASNNVLVGYEVGQGITTASNNIAIGHETAKSPLTTGSGNILIGYQVDVAAAGTSNFLTIGNLIFATGGFGTGVAVGAGFVGIGVPDPDTKLEVLINGIQLKLSNDATRYTTIAVDASNNTSFISADPSGTYGFNRAPLFTIDVLDTTDNCVLRLTGGTDGAGKSAKVNLRNEQTNVDWIAWLDQSDSDKFKIDVDASNWLTVTTGRVATIDGATTITGNLTMGGNIIIPDGGTVGQAAGPLLTFDDTNDFLEVTGCSVGIGVADPDAKVEILVNGTQLKLSNNATDYATFAVAADGALTITTVDADAAAADIILAPDGMVGVKIAVPISLVHIYENTANVDATAGFTVEQAGVGDAIVQFLLTGGQRFVAGIDNSDADKFKIARTANLNTNALFTITTDDLVGIGVGTDAPPTSIYIRGINILCELANDSGAVQYRRNSNTGRAQFSFQTEVGAEIWRVGLTAGGSTTFKFFDQTQDAFQMVQNGDIYINPGGDVVVGATAHNGGKLEVLDTGEQFRASYNASNWCSITVGANGNTTIATVDAGAGVVGHLHLVPDGNTTIGDGGAANYVQFDSTGDVLFVGSSGLAYGSMYTNVAIAVTATSGVWVEVDAAQAWTTGKVHDCTFTDPKITVTAAGTYWITYDLTMVASVANRHIETGIMIDSDNTDSPAHGAAGVQSEGRSHAELLANTDEDNVTGRAIIQLAAGKTVSLAVRNTDAGNPTVTVFHGNLVVVQIAGVSA